MGGKIIYCTIAILILIIIGMIFFLHKRSWFVTAICDKLDYDVDKTSKAIGFTAIGLAIACIPSLLSIILGVIWLNSLSCIVLIVALASITLIETSGKLKK